MNFEWGYIPTGSFESERNMYVACPHSTTHTHTHTCIAHNFKDVHVRTCIRLVVYEHTLGHRCQANVTR